MTIISIITPSLNQGDYIEDTIKSVISQKSEHFQLEYIIIDGGSCDQTTNILQQYHDQLIWYSEKDQGQSHALNKGLCLAKGEIIGWLNSDDVYHANTLNKIADFFFRHADIDIVYGDALFINQESQIIGFYLTEPWNQQRFKRRCFISQPATFFRRRALVKYGLLQESLEYCMDYEYWLRLCLKGARFAYMQEVLASARIHSKAKSVSCGVAASREVIAVVRNKLGYIPNEWLLNYALAEVKTRNLHKKYQQPLLSVRLAMTILHFATATLFLVAVWIRLWSVTGVYYQGLARIKCWFSIQATMIKEFIKRYLNIIKKRMS